MSVLRFLVTREALATLTKRSLVPTLQNIRAISSLANNNNNNSYKAIFAAKAIETPTQQQWQQQQTRGHKRFGHGEEKTPRVTKYFHLMVITLFIISVLDWGK